ncbi:MAG: VOC family protein [Halioglobus sp.]
MAFSVSGVSESYENVDGAFVDANGLWLQLVLASSPDSDLNTSGEKGNGRIFGLNFRSDAYNTMQQRMKSKGVDLFNIAGSPLSMSGDEIKLTLNYPESVGQRITCCANGEIQKTSVDIYEGTLNGERNFIGIRDQMWSQKEADRNVPRIDRIAIIVEDIEASIEFYTEVLELKRHPMQSGVDPDVNEEIGGFKPAFIFANSVWLVLIQPTGPGPLMDTLKKKGNGHVLEIITEVDDLDVFYDKMKSKGIILLCVDGKTPLNDNMKSQILEPFGDKLAYIPTDVSQGMVIEVFQRGPRATSLIHQRDDTFKDS